MSCILHSHAVITFLTSAQVSHNICILRMPLVQRTIMMSLVPMPTQDTRIHAMRIPVSHLQRAIQLWLARRGDRNIEKLLKTLMANVDLRYLLIIVR